jgi:hypothetical protein
MLVLSRAELVDLNIPKLNSLLRFLVFGSKVTCVILLLQTSLVNQIAISPILMSPLSLFSTCTLLLTRWCIFVELSCLNLRILIVVVFLNIGLRIIFVQGELLIALGYLGRLLLGIL